MMIPTYEEITARPIGTENIEDILDDLKGGFEALRASGLAK